MRIVLLVLVICTAVRLLVAQPATAAATRPNIILVLADDFGWGDISSQGGKVATPALDRMAKEGTIYWTYYLASRWARS